MYVDEVIRHFYRMRQFNEAWVKASAAAADETDLERQAYGVLIKGRIRFEFGQYQEAAGDLATAVTLYRALIPELDDAVRLQLQALADYASILATKCALDDPSVELDGSVREVDTPDAQRCYDLVRSDFMRNGMYDLRLPLLEFKSQASSELIIEQLRAHRRAIRSARSLHDAELFERASTNADAFFKRVEDDLSSPLTDVTSTQTGPLKERFSRYMGIVPFNITFRYLQAGLAYDQGNLNQSLDLFDTFLAAKETAGHVAARVGHVRVRRELGYDAIDLCTKYADELKAEEFQPARGEPTRFVHVERALLTWTRAANVSAFQPAEAIRLCGEADSIIADHIAGRPHAAADNIPQSQSYSVIGYHLARGDEEEALRLARRLLRDWRLGDLVEFLNFDSHRSPGSMPGHETPQERLKRELGAAVSGLPSRGTFPALFRSRAHAALIVIPDLLRGIGRIPEAMAWLEAIFQSSVSELDERKGLAEGGAEDEGDNQGAAQARLGPSLHNAESDQSSARYMSLLNLIGLHGEAGEVANALPGNSTRSKEVQREVALSLLGQWQRDAAEREFRELATAQREDAAIWGLNGLIDVARRDERHALRLTGECIKEFESRKKNVAPLSHAALAAVELAGAWVELQHGRPEQALDEFISGLKNAPHDVTGWIGMVRCLRVLGRHKEAIAILDWLREPERLSLPRRLRPATRRGTAEDLADIARGTHLRYLPLLEVERGWCYVDIDEFEMARESFEDAAQRAPYIMSGQRGRLAAMVKLRPHQVDGEIDGIVADVEVWSAGLTADARTLLDTLRNELVLESGRLMTRLSHHEKADDLFDAYLRRMPPIGAGPNVRRHQLRLLRIAEAYLDADRRAAAKRVLNIFDDNQRRTAGATAAVTMSPNGSSADRVVRLFRVRWLLANRDYDEAQREMADLIESTYPGLAPGELPPVEHLAVAKLIVLFESRQYVDSLRLADPPATPNAGIGYGSDVRRIIAAWSALALAELEPHAPSKRRVHVERAEDLLDQTDRTSVEEIHLAAILRALRSGPIGRLRPSEPGGRRLTKSVTIDIEMAIAELDRAVRRRPYSGAIRRDKAALLIALDRLDEASTELDRARNYVVNGPRIDLLTGVIAYKRAQFGDAVHWFRQAVDQDERDHVHHRALAVAQFANGQHHVALATITNAITRLSTESPAGVRQLEATAVQLVALRLGQVGRRDQASEFRRLLTPDVQRAINSQRVEMSVTPVSEHDVETALALADIDSAGRRPRSALARRDAVRRRYSDHPGLATRSPIQAEQSFDLTAWRRRFVWLFVVSAVVVFGGAVAGAFVPLLSGDAEAVATSFSEKAFDLFLLGPAVFGVAFLISIFEQRMTGLKVANMFEATLETADPVPEIVHVDLDMSVSRLLVVSGFSHFRPEVRNFLHDDRSLFGQ